MSIEIERKFLVLGDDWRAQVHASRRMDQGYLVPPGGSASVRVRIAGDEARLNIKAAVVGAQRAEFDYGIPLADGEQLLGELSVGRVQKTRHLIDLGGWTWEVDEFEGDNAGLIVAEIELDAVDAVFQRPDWLGREVTEESRFYNHQLAVTPYAQWPAGDRA